MPASCTQDSTTCITQLGNVLNCTGTIEVSTPSLSYHVCKCGPPGSNPIVTVPTNISVISNATIIAPFITPKGCSGATSTEQCSSTLGLQRCGKYTGGGGGCGRYVCPGGDCDATSTRIDSSFQTIVCDDTIQGNGTSAYICNCKGTVNTTLAASITQPDFSYELKSITNCTQEAFEEIVPVTDALAGIQAADSQIDLSPVLLNATIRN